MKILKFGGASIKDAEAIKNVCQVLNTVKADQVLIVISAMGKTTNALEQVVHHYFDDKTAIQRAINVVQEQHFDITSSLFPVNHLVFGAVEKHFEALRQFLEIN